MAVQISEDIPSSETELDPQYVATAFVEQYYRLLQNSPEIVHKFYNDQSTLDRQGPDGEMIGVMTMEGINDMIMSSDYKGCLFEAINVDAQVSLMGGVLVAVNGCLIGKDNLKKSFSQTFFLAQQPKGYYVLNDILRFMEVLESETLPTSNGTKENVSDVPLTHDQETPEIPVQPKEVMDSGEKVLDVDCGEKTPDGETGKKASDDDNKKALNGETGKNFSDIETGKKVSDDDNKKALNGETGKNFLDTETGNKALDDDSKKTSDIDSRKITSDIDSGKKKVSEIKDTMAEVPNSSVNESKNESSLTQVASNEKQDSKKTSYASMVAKESKVASPTHKTGYKIVRVAANADQQSVASATPRDPGTSANSVKNEQSGNGAAGNYNAQTEAPAAKSIYIANLPSNITKYALVDALKIFGRVRPGGVQIRTFEDGFCFGFVEFESASAASKAVEVHNITVGGNEAYMMYKKSGSRSGNSSGGNAGSRNSNFKGQENEEIRGGGGYQDDNQADLKSRPRGFRGQDGETRAGRARSKSTQMSDERLPAGEAQWKNGQRRENRGRSGDAYHQQNNKKKQ